MQISPTIITTRQYLSVTVLGLTRKTNCQAYESYQSTTLGILDSCGLHQRRNLAYFASTAIYRRGFETMRCECGREGLIRQSFDIPFLLENEGTTDKQTRCDREHQTDYLIKVNTNIPVLISRLHVETCGQLAPQPTL